MLIFDLITIGNKLYAIRKRCGMTQMEVAVEADISERTYADFERGTLNIRIETFLRICQALHISPDEVLTADDTSITSRQEELLERLEACSSKDKETALKLLTVFLEGLS